MVSVIGLGKLGLPIAACFAERYYTVIGVDSDPVAVDRANRNTPRYYEPGLQELLDKNSARFRATSDFNEAVSETDVSFIVVSTPSTPRGDFSLEYVTGAVRGLGAALKGKDSYHLVVLTSTVMPGDTGNKVKTLVERESGKRCAQDFGLCYSPEFFALGRVIQDFLNPDFVLIGESDESAGASLESIFNDICLNTPKIARMNFANAELAKLAVNTYITTKITFANCLARLCERLPGANVDEVTGVLGMDSRIGSKYLKGAVGYGGPCFPRDNLAFCHLADSLDTSGLLARATEDTNREQLDYLVELVVSRLPKGGTAGILGLSFKPDTGVAEESPGLLLAARLAELGVPVLAYDPQAIDDARAQLSGSVKFASSCKACIREADLIAITTPWDEFKKISTDILLEEKNTKVVIDCWRILEPDKFKNVCDLIQLGIGEKEDGVN